MASKWPRLPKRGRSGLDGLHAGFRKQSSLPACLFCSSATPARVRPISRHGAEARRFESSAATISDSRIRLEQTLVQLQAQHPTLINPSRMQLALQGLRQEPGQEAVRVAILELANGSNGGDLARKVLQAVLADPLNDEEEWERVLQKHEATKPLIVRIGPSQQDGNTLTLSKSSVPAELHVSSPAFNGLDLELLLLGIDIPTTPDGAISIASVEETLLVPAVDIPSPDDRFTPMTTPVHQALLVSDGFNGAVKLSSLPLDNGSLLLAAVDFKGVSKDQLGVDFEVIDSTQANQAIQVFRQGPQHAMEYERQWTASNVPRLISWIKAGIQSPESETKPAVRKLIASLLENVLATIQEEEGRKVSKIIVSTDPITLEVMNNMNKGLAEWSQGAHAELQDQLDVAFTSKRWRKLGWWKLFWRVDDVAMLTNDMLSQRFLPTTERELVFLAGRIAQSGVTQRPYPQPTSQLVGVTDGLESKRLGSAELEPAVPVIRSTGLPKWPGHITFTRRYLQNETVPALQALAQKLVMQSLSLSSLTTSLAALMYVSSFSSTIYEAGAVAALGIVYSLSRLQKKWETARDFWEGEVREEGRKAVRATEESVAEVLDQGQPKPSSNGEDELQKARELVSEAEDALARMK